MQSKDSFTVTIERFVRDGEKLAVMKIDNPSINPSSQSYCDKEEIINKVFYNSYTKACRELNNAGLVDTKNQ